MRCRERLEAPSSTGRFQCFSLPQGGASSLPRRSSAKARPRRKPRVRAWTTLVGERPRALERLSGRLFLRIEEALEMADPGRMPQLAQRFGLDLPDALARDVVHLPDLLERALVA